ncbi:glycohydrolase toxin TNT-related protein [Actinophytocola sp. NPDC049390]|uniref:glycohydrolase toxin TNT-related protein n=1 Tax=Actinophytocola sp. NPDC049390 TaxID=3363894 RepID=UPI0037910218
MGIELPPELADVAAQAGVVWPEADEEAMARQAQAWRDTATTMSTLTTDADTTARSALSAVTGDAGDAAANEWKSFVEADSGHLTSVVRDANAAADRLEHAAGQVGAAKVEIVRNLVHLAQNTDAAHTAASAGHPTALAGLETAVRGTAANVAHIESQLVSAVQPGSGVDIAAVQTPVNANPGHHLLPGVTTTVTDVASPVTDAVASTVDSTVGGTVDTATQLPGNVAGPAAGVVGDTADTLRPTPGHGMPGDVVPGIPGDLPPGDVPPGDGSGVLPGRPDGVLPADPDITGPVPSDVIDDTIDDTPTPPTGQTVQAGFAGGLEPAVAPPPNLPPAATAPPVANPAAPPAYGGGQFGGAPAAPVGGAPAPAAPVPAPGRPAAPAAPAPVAPAPVRQAPAAYVPSAERPADPAPRAGKPMAGPPGAPPPAKGERNEVLAAFWIHMFPIGHLPVASYRPARQTPAPPPELDYAAGLRFEPADHPDHRLVDDRPRLAELHEGIAHRAATKAAADAAPAQLPPPSTPPGYQSYAPPSAYQYPPPHPAPQVGGGMSYTGLGQQGYPRPPVDEPAPAAPSAADVSPDAATLPRFRPVNPSAGITADHPAVQALLEHHDPLGGANERDWDRRYLVRLGSVTPQGISPEGLEYNWPTSEQYPEGGSAPGEAETLAEDTVIDRFGSPHGRVFAVDGTMFAQRSLPPEHKDAGYRRYRVVKPLPVWRAVSAAWFGQPGGGVRYRTTHSAIELVALGYLEEIA